MERYLIFFTCFHHNDLAMLFVYLAFTTQYSNIPLCSFFCTPVVLFNLRTESKNLTFVNTNGRPDMLTRKVMNEKFI